MNKIRGHRCTKEKEKEKLMILLSNHVRSHLKKRVDIVLKLFGTKVNSGTAGSEGHNSFPITFCTRVCVAFGNNI
jgi:hypothetical protein